MKVLIQGKQMKVSDDLKQYVYDHLVGALTRFYDNEAAELRVEFGDTNGPKGGDDKECHLTLRMPGARAIQIENSTPDPYASLDAAASRLIRAAHREVERMREPVGHKERPLGSVVSEGGVPGGLIEDLPNAKELEEAAHPAGEQ